MGHIIHGAYHIDFRDEIDRLRKEVEKVGINNPNNIELTALIALKNRNAKMSTKEVFDFFKRLRGFR